MFIKSLCAAAMALAFAAAAPARAQSSDPALGKYADKTIHWREGVITEVDGKSMDFKVEGRHLPHTKGLARLGNGLSESYSSLSRHEVDRMHSAKFATVKDTRIFFSSECCSATGAGALDRIRVGDVVRVGYLSPLMGKDRPISVEMFDHNSNLTRQAKQAQGLLDPVTAPINKFVIAPVTSIISAPFQ